MRFHFEARCSMQDFHSKPLQSTGSRSTMAGNGGRKVPARVVLKRIRRIWLMGQGGVAETAHGMMQGLVPSDMPLSMKEPLTCRGKWVARGLQVLAMLLVTWALPVQGVTTQPVFQTHYPNPTADKPQSKLWFAHDTWWALLPTATGPSLWQRSPAGWSAQTAVRQTFAGLPGRCDVWFDEEDRGNRGAHRLRSPGVFERGFPALHRHDATTVAKRPFGARDAGGRTVAWFARPRMIWR
jgi:hypothetical protein